MIAFSAVVPGWLDLFAHSHVLLLHLPIGLCFGVAALEFGGALIRRSPARPTIAVLAWLLALTAGLTATSGWYLGYEPGDHDANLLDQHRLLGILTASACVVAAVLSGFKSRWPFRALLLVACGLMVPTGHFGGSLTHGSNFLFLPLQHEPKTAASSGQPDPKPSEQGSNAAVPATNHGTPAPSGTYAEVIAPILARTCSKCHGPEKRKGNMRLDSAQGIANGGKEGFALVAGKPDTSPMLVRVNLPLDDDDHMPPKGKPQPTAAEIAALQSWIAAGAPEVASLTPVALPKDAAGTTDPADEPEPKKDGPKKEETAKAQEPAPAPESAVSALVDALVHVAPIAAGSNLLWVDFAATAPKIDDAKAQQLLAPVREQLAELGLARTAITDAALPLLAGMPRLQKLDLRDTAVTDQGIALLQTLPHLRELNLVGTKLTDAVVPHLVAMPALKSVYLWKAGLSAEALQQLRQNKNLAVDAGDAAAAAPLEAETKVELSKDAPAVDKKADEKPPDAQKPGAQPAPAAVVLTPINSVCPVSGKPVDPRYTIVFEGKVIGFCCPNCPKTFWTEPTKYPVQPR